MSPFIPYFHLFNTNSQFSSTLALFSFPKCTHSTALIFLLFLPNFLCFSYLFIFSSSPYFRAFLSFFLFFFLSISCLFLSLSPSCHTHHPILLILPLPLVLLFTFLSLFLFFPISFVLAHTSPFPTPEARQKQHSSGAKFVGVFQRAILLRPEKDILCETSLHLIPFRETFKEFNSPLPII